MSDPTSTQDQPQIRACVQSACDIATSRSPADPATAGIRTRGAMKDLNCKGNGPEWYRMVYRAGSWRYISDERLPRGSYLASDRRATVYGEVYPGEIVVEHDRGGPVDAAWLVFAKDAEDKYLLKTDFRLRRDGQIAFVLKDGSEVVLPNPRSKDSARSR